MIEAYFIGTGAAIPSKDRGHTTVALRYKGNVFLFDCGENTQRRLIQEGLSPMKIENIFISHLHTDHVAGLYPFPETMYLLKRTKPLDVWGPRGLEKWGENLQQIQHFNFGYELTYHDLPNSRVQEIVEGKDFTISSMPVKHGTPSLAYCFKQHDWLRFLEKKALKMGVEPGPLRGKLTHRQDVKIGKKTIKWQDVTEQVIGKKVVISGDTGPLKEMVKFAEGADLLIHEATFAEDKKDEAEEFFHTTAKQAAEIAKKAKVKQLALIHFSQRYRTNKVLVEEAKEVFKETVGATDGMKLVVK